MGYRQLEVLPSDAFAEAEEKLEELLNRYIEHGQVFKYSSIEERNSLE